MPGTDARSTQFARMMSGSPRLNCANMGAEYELQHVSFAGKRVTILGLGTHGGGVAAARWMAEEGAIVTISDAAPAARLERSVQALVDVPIARWSLGGHQAEDLARAEWVVVNPGVPPHSPWLRCAGSATRLTTEIELFLARCPARVIGVTGTVGKSTTASMLAAMLTAAGRAVWLGGNIGASLLPSLGRIQADDVVVLELSSFQLHYLSEAARWPELAVITNCYPNHLAWHGDFARYAEAKRRLVSHAVRVVMPCEGEVGGWHGSNSAEVLPLVEVARESLHPQLSGDHDRLNAALAATAAVAMGADEASIAEALRQFSGLPHRQQWVAELAGRRFVNDSKATTPSAVAAAVAAQRAPTWLLLGGRDQGGDWQLLVDAALTLWPVNRVLGAALFGADAERIAAQLAPSGWPLACFETLADALKWCWQRSARGETILLSPGCASFDQFADFTQRGEHFCQLVQGLAGPLPR